MKCPETIDITPRNSGGWCVSCHCGYYEKAHTYPTNAGTKRGAILLAMNHNTLKHSYGYKIQGGSS